MTPDTEQHDTTTMNFSSRLKPVLNMVVQSSVAGSFMRLLERANSVSGNAPEPGYGCQILTYHYIENAAGFAEQMAYLARHYDVISTPELLAAVREGNKLPPRAMLITFDDAYSNFGDCAWPILQQYRLPATVFVPTAFPDSGRSFWWDQVTYAILHTGRAALPELHRAGVSSGSLPLQNAQQRKLAIKQMKGFFWALPPSEVQDTLDELLQQLDVTPPPSEILGWDQLRRLASEGVTFGAHTRTHPNLALLSAAEVQAQVSGSLQDLEREIGQRYPASVVPVLAYPGGYYSRETVEAVAETDIEMAFTVARGTNDIRQVGGGRADTANANATNADAAQSKDGPYRLEMRRNNVGVAATLPVLRARLLQAAPSLHRVRHLIG
jgi:peptidoglycan/xylan/chitin deacetylase (PgdA/CDA1 family)